MKKIEVRIQAATNFPNHGGHNQSKSYYLDVPSLVDAARILRELRKTQALTDYINENTIPADSNAAPLLFSSLNDQGEFSISLPSTISGVQFFFIRIII